MHQARLPSCSSTLSIAEVLLREFQCMLQALPPAPTTLLTSCVPWPLPVFPLSCLLTLLLNSCQWSPPPILSVPSLCACMGVVSCHQEPILSYLRTVSDPRSVSTLQDEQTSITRYICQLLFNLPAEVERCLNDVFEWKWYRLSESNVSFLSLSR